jgi:hypothetical protein
MTREEAKVMASVLNAWADRKPIQFRNQGGDWFDLCGDSLPATSLELRIKPEPREWWIVRDVGCGTVPYCFNSHERARATATAGALPDARELIHVREVL